MELSPADKERLTKAAIAAAALVTGGAIVHYVRNSKGSAEGYVYRTENENVLIGVYTDNNQVQIAQIGGRVIADSFELDDPEILPADVKRFEEVFPIKTIDPPAS